MIPETLYIVLGVCHADLVRMGFVGFVEELNSDNEISWSESLICLDKSRREVQTFLRVQAISNTDSINGPRLRISISDARTYFNRYDDIEDFLSAFDANKYLRLGSRASLEPWELNSKDSFILRMSTDDFHRYYISDPRRTIPYSGIIRGSTLHSPVLRGSTPPGLSDPEDRGWILGDPPTGFVTKPT